MQKPKVIMTIYKEDQGYSATGEYNDYFMCTVGDSFEELQDMIVDCVNLTFEDLGFKFTIDEIKLEPDLKSFFKFYKVINLKLLSERVGIDREILSQYIKGLKKPTSLHKRKILKGIEKLGKELAEIEFLT